MTMRFTMPHDTTSISDQPLKECPSFTQESMNLAEQQSTVESVTEWQYELLEKRYKGLASLIVELQSELEVLKLDIESSNSHMLAISPLTDQQFEIFEKRIESHREGLCQFLYQRASTIMTSIKKTKQQEPLEPVPATQASLPTPKISFSSMASSISSFFLSDNSDVETNDSYYDCLGSRAQLRRRKRQQLRHSYDQHCTNESYGDLNFKVKNQSLSDLSSLSEKYSYFDSAEIIKAEENNKINAKQSRSSTICHHHHHHHHHQQQQQQQKQQQDDFLCKSITELNQNAAIQQSQFKDIISYLNDIPILEDDSELCEDLLCLLEDMDEKEPSSNPITKSSPRSLQLNTMLKRSITDMISSGYRWTKFVLVISLATVICLRRGMCDSLPL